jgi:hypothetical protein
MLLLKKVPLQKSDTKWETKKLSFQSLWLFLSVTSWLCLRILWFFPRKIWLMSYVMLQMFTKQILQITMFAFSSVFLSYGHTSSLIQSYLHQNSLVSHLISLFIQSQGLDPTQTSREKTGENSSISTTPWNKVTSSWHKVHFRKEFRNA